MNKTLREIGVLMKEKEGSSAAFDRLMSERQNVVDYVKGCVGQREQVQTWREDP